MFHSWYSCWHDWSSPTAFFTWQPWCWDATSLKEGSAWAIAKGQSSLHTPSTLLQQQPGCSLYELAFCYNKVPKMSSLWRKGAYFGTQFWRFTVQDQSRPNGSSIRWSWRMTVAEYLWSVTWYARKTVARSISAFKTSFLPRTTFQGHTSVT